MLNDYDLFGPIEGNSGGLGFELTEVFGPEVNNASPSNTISRFNSSDDDITDDYEPMTLGSRILFQWEKRKKKVEHDYSIYCWDLSVMPVVQDNAVERMTCVHRDYIELVVKKMHEPPCPNKSKEIEGKTIGDILHIFWLELKYFQHKAGPFDKESIWLVNTALVGKSHV